MNPIASVGPFQNFKRLINARKMGRNILSDTSVKSVKFILHVLEIVGLIS